MSTRTRKAAKFEPRKQRKIKGQVSRILAIGVHIGAAPRRTGQPEWFRLMKQEIEIRTHLQKLRLSFLATKFGVNQRIISSLEMAGYRSIWDVSRTTLAALKVVPGLGRAGIKELSNALRDNNVATKWSVV